ncbi:MAG TPA: ABC transporter substrate-binding protein [Actinomycetes bacterium]|nr:ABC transporter substrate-binding protein [Actinomycetes bacterium]
MRHPASPSHLPPAGARARRKPPGPGRPSWRPGRRARGAVAAVLVALAGCGGHARHGGSLAGACPDPVVVQTDWFPGPEYGALYQLIGARGRVEQGAYRGPLGDSGVRLEIRPGGTALAGDSVAARMYQDPAILLGSVSTDESVRDSGELPTVGVVSPLDRSPRVLLWDPRQFRFRTVADIGRSQASVVHPEGDATMEVLAHRRSLRRGQLDPSFDGSPVRFTTEQSIVQEGTLTNEPFVYEHELPDWHRPVGFLLVDQSGFRPYPALAVRSRTLATEADCLARLVPRIQRAQVDYLADPAPVDARLREIAGQFAALWTVSPAAVADGVRKLRALQVASNGPNRTVGDFDEARVARVVRDAAPAFRTPEVDPVKPRLTAAEVATNRFVDPRIGLPGG